MIKKVKDNKGFTLIELIVVIGIVGILTGIASPKFTGHSKDADVAAMKADTKTLSTAAEVFYANNDEWPSATEITEHGVGGAERLFLINKDSIEKSIKNIKGDYDDYAISIDGDDAGKVYHVEGVKGRDGLIRHTMDDNRNAQENEIASYEFSSRSIVNGELVDSNGNNAGKLIGFSDNEEDYIKDNGIFFNGSSSIRVPNSTELDFNDDRPFTINVWFNAETGGPYWYGLISKGNRQQYALTLNTSARYLHFEDLTQRGSARGTNSPNGSFNFNTWHMATIQYDGIYKKIFLDGKEIKREKKEWSKGNNNEDLRIGEANNGEHFKGTISDISIYRETLYEKELKEMYDKGIKNFK